MINRTNCGSPWRGRSKVPWVQELENCWRSESQHAGSRAIVIDLHNVWLIDRAGKKLLASMRVAGAKFEACGILMAELKEAGAAHLGLIAISSRMPSSRMGPATHPARADEDHSRGGGSDLALRENPNVQVANLNYAESQENTRLALAGCGRRHLPDLATRFAVRIWSCSWAAPSLASLSMPDPSGISIPESNSPRLCSTSRYGAAGELRGKAKAARGPTRPLRGSKLRRWSYRNTWLAYATPPK